MSATAALPTESALGPDHPSGVSPASEPTRWRYRMIAAADPGLLPRLVAPVAKLGLVPERCSFTLRDDGLAIAELTVSGIDSRQAEHLRLVYAVLPAMRAVDLACV